MRGRFRGDREEICRRHVTPPPTHTRGRCVSRDAFFPTRERRDGKRSDKKWTSQRRTKNVEENTHTQRQREKTLETARRRKRRRDQREERSLAKRDEEERNRESERPKSDDDDDDDDERYISHSFVASVFFFR